jgi:hypothetical protein
MAMADDKLEPVIGRAVPPRGLRKVLFSHSAGWNAALDDALSKTHWRPLGEHDNVRVEFSAKVRVTNPGSIVEYCATLIPPGH